MKYLQTLLFLFLISSGFSQSQFSKASLQTIDGSKTTLEQEFDLEKETIIAFWATWCGPCLKELDAIHGKYAEWNEEKDFNFVAITIDDPRGLQRVKPMVEGRGWQFKVLADPNQDFARSLNVPTPPYTVILKNGEVIYTKSGYKPGDEDVLFSQIDSGVQQSGFLPKGLQVAVESNTSWYLEDDKVPLAVDTNQLRTNTYIKADYQFLENFRATAQLESYEREALLDYSRIYKGTDLGTYSLNYSNDLLNVTAGHFYDQWGSGLLFRAFEDRQLGLNTAVLGGRIEVKPTDKISITGMAGKQRLGFDLADSFLYGGNAEFNLLQNDSQSLNVGVSTLFKKEDVEEGAEFTHDELVSMAGARLNYTVNDFFVGVETNFKSKEPILDGLPPTQYINEEYLYPGNSIQLNAGYAKSGFGINGTFRRMEGMSFYSERLLQADQFNQGVLNYIPALTKQQDYSLMNRYVHQPYPGVTFETDFADGSTLNEAGEIGGQLDVFYQFKEGSPLGGEYGTNVTLNMSAWHNIDADYDYFTRSYTNEKLIGFGNKFYSDLSLEIRKKFSEKNTQILTLFTQDNVERHAKAKVAAWEGLFQTGKNQSLRLEGQHLWGDDSEKDWWAATAEYAFSPSFSIFAADMQNYGNDNENLQFHNYNIGTSFTKGTTRADIMYGRRPSGLLCVGGVCRQVSAASGLHLNLTTTLR